MTDTPSWEIPLIVCLAIPLVSYLWWVILVGRNSQCPMKTGDRIRLLAWSHLSGFMIFPIFFLQLFLVSRLYNLDYNEALLEFYNPLVICWAIVGHLLISVFIACFLAPKQRSQTKGIEK